jgi:heme/copper-type cytochrome/quinol oxidase subunit 3
VTDIVADDLTLERNPSGQRSTAVWGTWGLLATEGTLFATLIASYFYLRLNAPVWPLPGEHPPELTLALPNTLVLVASSVVLGWAGSRRRRGADRAARIATAVTALMGVAFVTIQGFEFAGRHVGVRDDAQATAFTTITGLHTAHVVVGVLLLAFLVVRGRRAPASGHRTISLYWHFVDVVWLAVFTSLYLAERW